MKGLDDKVQATAHSIATRPGSYRPGTLAALADAYDQAGEPDRAAPIRRLAEREGFLLSFARSSAEAQQRQIDSLPPSDERAGAEAIQDRQVQAFAKDPFAAGTALYPDVGSAKPIDDIEGRVTQARTIAAYRGIAVVPFTADELARMRQQYAHGTPQEREAVLTLVNSLPDDVKPALDGPSSGGPHTFSIGAAPSMATNGDLPEQGANENAAAATTSAGAAAPTTEPLPGSPEFEEADRQAREVDQPSWNDLSFLQQLGVEFERLNEQSKARGATLGVDSAGRHLAQVQELQRRKDAGEELNVTEERYLLRNRRAASDLATSMSRLIEARRNLDRLPASDALREFLAAPSASEAGRLLREKPREIAKALGVESVPALTVSLIASALGPVAGGLVLAGTSGLDGYANGLIGALAEEGVDITDPEELAEALHDKELMDHVRDQATTKGAIEGGIATLSILGGLGGAKTPLKLRRAEQLALNVAKGQRWQETMKTYYKVVKGFEVGEQITVQTPKGGRVRLDLIVRDGEGRIRLIELKSGKKWRLSPNQKKVFAELEEFGGTIVGEGKGAFRGGVKIPPRKVDVETPQSTGIPIQPKIATNSSR